MGLATGALLAVGVAAAGVVGTALSRVLADDFKEWAPHIIEWLINRAVDRLPGDCRDRMAEEWRSHVNEVPGTIGKLFAAACYSRAASAMTPTIPHSGIIRHKVISSLAKSPGYLAGSFAGSVIVGVSGNLIATAAPWLRFASIALALLGMGLMIVCMLLRRDLVPEVWKLFGRYAIGTIVKIVRR